MPLAQDRISLPVAKSPAKLDRVGSLINTDTVGDLTPSISTSMSLLILLGGLPEMLP
jgi:hypothetical protein